MKNVYGLLFALALGVAGGLLNWTYLARKSRDLERVAFVGVKQGVVLRPGDVFRAEDLEPVYFPKERVGNLIDYGVLYTQVSTVQGTAVSREIDGGQLVLDKDLTTVPPEPRQLESDEREIGIPVDTRTFVPSLYRAGDLISFIVPKTGRMQPTPAAAVEDAIEDNDPALQPTPTAVAAAAGTETIGPFEIRTIGNRVASTDLSQARRLPQVQENVVNIIVKVQGDDLEPRAQKLLALMLNANVRQFAVLGHPRPKQ
jgi:hypothetical protein